jgi:hypothetical protein
VRRLNMPTSSESHIEATLRKIGRRVLEEVWISGRLRAVAATAVAVLVAVTIIGLTSPATEFNAHARMSWLSCIATAFFGLAALVSSLAVCRPRFRWCCAAAYISAIATIVGLGMVWWHRTAPPGSSPGLSAWMVTGVFAAAVLSLTWLGVILTPSERSQPDMRAAAATTRARIGPHSA